MKFLAKSFEIPSFLALGMALGAAAGFTVHHSLKPTLITFEGDAAEFVMDDKAAYEKYERVAAKGGNFAVELEPCELVSVAYTRFSQKEFSFTEALGSSKAMGLVDQCIQSRTFRDGERFFEESNSFSNFVKIYNRMYQEGDETTKYWGNSPTYSGYSPQTITNEEYAQEMGRKVSEALIYLVSPKTQSDNDRSGQGLTKVETTPEGNIVVDFEADPISSTLRYVKQMKTISKLKEYPAFDYVHLRFTMTKDLDLLHMRSFESYQATLESGISSGCAGTMTTIYQTLKEGEVHIPSPADPSNPYPSTEEELLQKYGY